MKLKNLIKCHLSYLLSKSSIVIISLIVVLLVIIYMASAISSDYVTVKENVDGYFYSCISITKVIYITLSCFMMASFYSVKNDAYLSLLVASNIKKTTHYLTKIYSIILVLLIIIFIIFLLFLLMGFLFIKGFVFQRRYLLSFLSLYLISICYGVEAVILSVIFKNMFTFLIPTLASLVMQGFVSSDAGLIKNILFLVFPVFDSAFFKAYYDLKIVVLVASLLIILSLIIYNNSEYASE